MRVGTTALTAAAMLGSCRDPYPLPPTQCDDYCFAVQRAGCAEDDPASCVSDCEAAGLLRQSPECAEPWDARNRCYFAATDEHFSCVEEVSLPDADLCWDERATLVGCVSPLAGLCLENCGRNERACGGNVANCDQDCLGQGGNCEREASAFYRCSLQAPVDCGDSESDTQLEDIPCLPEIGSWFDCLDQR